MFIAALLPPRKISPIGTIVYLSLVPMLRVGMQTGAYNPTLPPEYGALFKISSREKQTNKLVFTRKIETTGGIVFGPVWKIL